MQYLLFALGVTILAGAVLRMGLWWRLLWPFRIAPARMSVKQLGLGVCEAAKVERVDAILASFIGGFNRMLTEPTVESCRGHCDALPTQCQPFAHEGLAMGYTLRRLFRYDPQHFEDSLVKARPEFRYLYYVGLGFWSGMRNHKPERVHRITEHLDPMYRYLCFDGYGFKFAFFDLPKDPGALQRLEGLEGYARSAAHQGVGRALYFLHMDQPRRLVERMEALGAFAADAASGAGLAAVFVFPDRLDVARTLALELPPDLRPHFHLGMCFGLKARSINDVDQFEDDMAGVKAPVREAVFASIRECDRVELLVRSEERPDGYREWRRRVTEWMSLNIVYPLSGLKQRKTDRTQAEARRAEEQDVRVQAHGGTK